MWNLPQRLEHDQLVAGHEVVGTIAQVGNEVKTLKPGQRVGLGWDSRSCMTCEWCMSGNHNLCLGAEGTIVGRYSGFADAVRAHEAWVIPLPGAIGIGGLGHMGLRFLHAWGCDVTAFSTCPDKEPEARELGANHFINSRDEKVVQGGSVGLLDLPRRR